MLREKKYEVFEKILLRKKYETNKKKYFPRKTSKKFAFFFKYILAIVVETPSPLGFAPKFRNNRKCAKFTEISRNPTSRN